MFQFPEFPIPIARDHAGILLLRRRSDSAIPGSKTACVSPGLIAACHGLLQRLSLVIHLTAYTCQDVLDTVQLG